MGFQKYYDQTKPVAHPPCLHLRSKAIYVSGDLRNPEHPEEAGAQYCWCNRTQHVVGPDQQCVGRQECIPGRNCYEESA